MLKLKNSLSILVIFIFYSALHAQNSGGAGRTILNLDAGWRFMKGDAAGADALSYDDSGWRKIDVPHDWSIEGPYDKANPTSRGGGYLPAGIGWYRKSLSLGEEHSKKKVFIEFDGIMANSEVWINGFYLGKRPYGYSSFIYDLTEHIKFGRGESNIISVKADNTVQPASRYYAGAGIYRHVRLVITDPVHIDHCGVFISTSRVSGKSAVIKVETSVVNQSSSKPQTVLQTSIIDPSGKVVKTSESKLTLLREPASVSQAFEVSDPALWDIDDPVLYCAVTKIRSGNNTVDEVKNYFGIRDSRFEAETGYWLNGRNIKIKGVCLHHDGGAFGSAVPLGIWERRFELLKECGVNAIRTGHNPVAPEFLDLCDRMGFLVMDETFDTWNAAKPNGEKGYNLYFTEWWEADTRAMVKRDRNHPSVIIYSVGNEIRDNLNDSSGFKKYRDQQDLVHRLDPTRPVTMALFRPNTSKVYSNGFAEMMDIVGQNYRENELVAVHLAKPSLKVIGTENGHGLAEWLILRDNPFMSGQFLWIGIDYLGEALWPAISFDRGLFDRTGGWKTPGLQRQSWWSDKPVVHMVRREHNAGEGELVANWTPVDVGTYDDSRVEVYSNCDEVELFLNGRSLGRKEKPVDDSPRSWEITFEKGTIRAVGKNNGSVVATEEMRTAGAPARIMLTADKSAISNRWDDLSCIKAIVVDAEGVVCPHADNLVTFTVSEPGFIAAVDNGDTSSHEQYQASERHSYNGQCVAYVKAKTEKGRITVNASSPGLVSGAVTIEISRVLPQEN